MPTNIRDPRTLITHDAFELDERLLGLPLAPPWRRFWAMVVDLAAVGTLTAVLSNVQLLLWTVIGLVLLRAAFQRSGRTMSQAAGALLRVAVGCLGMSILGVVAITFAVFRFSGDPEGMESDRVGAGIERLASAGNARLLRLVAGMAAAELATAEEAEDRFAEILEELGGSNMTPETERQLLLASVPEDAPWAPQATTVVDAAIARADARRRRTRPDSTGAGAAASTPLAGGSADGSAGADLPLDVDGLSPAATLVALSRLVEEGADSTSERFRALRARAASLVAGDTLDALAGQVRALEGALEEERATRSEVMEDAAGRSGATAFADLLRDVWDQLGSAIGLWSIYFTVLLTLWDGQTLGKRLTGVRVLRLDGAPITWWAAFERAGGYIAGLATGLLGFAQVFWDPNRQCIHDKIVGTVVIDARVPREPGPWQQAWGEAAPPERQGP